MLECLLYMSVEWWYSAVGRSIGNLKLLSGNVSFFFP